jgi:hypothetical protein
VRFVAPLAFSAGAPPPLFGRRPVSGYALTSLCSIRALGPRHDRSGWCRWGTGSAPPEYGEEGRHCRLSPNAYRLAPFEVREPGLEPGRVSPLDPKSSASANSATLAHAMVTLVSHCKVRIYAVLPAESPCFRIVPTWPWQRKHPYHHGTKSPWRCPSPWRALPGSRGKLRGGRSEGIARTQVAKCRKRFVVAMADFENPGNTRSPVVGECVIQLELDL